MDKLSINERLGDDLLDGAEEIARFMGWSPRRIFYLAEKKLIPAFKLGNRWIARKSSLKKFLDELEDAETESSK